MQTIVYTCVTCLCLVAGVVVAQQAEDTPAAQPTNFASLERFIREYTDEVEGGNGQWAFEVAGVPVMVLADQAADRMRIMTPVANVADFEDDEFHKLLLANYDRALDARYAINNGILWSAFIHPMSSLSHQQLDDGLEQVIRLADNFGTTYASTDMLFAPGGLEPEEQPKQEPLPPLRRGAPPAPRS